MVGNTEDDRPPFQLRSFRPEDLTRYKGSGAEEATLTGDLEKMYSITALPGPSLSKPGRAATGLRDGRRNCSLQSGDRAQAFTSLPGGHRSSLAAHVRGGHWRCGHWRGRSQAHGALGPGAWLRDPNGMGPAWGAAGLQTAGELPADPSGRSDPRPGRSRRGMGMRSVGEWLHQGRVTSENKRGCFHTTHRREAAPDYVAVTHRRPQVPAVLAMGQNEGLSF